MYDVIVMGGGPGGYSTAMKLGKIGKTVLLVEEKNLGGVCLNEGCVPSKTFLHSAKIADYAKGGEKYGVIGDLPKIDQQLIVERKNKVVKKLVSGVQGGLKKAGVTIAQGKATLVEKGPDGFIVEENGNRHKAAKVIVATGSKAVVPPIEGLQKGIEEGWILTNREILNLESIPKKLVVVGGGVIGLEMASYFNSMGSEVEVVEMASKIAGPTEEKVSEILQKNLERQGIRFHLNAKVTRFDLGTSKIQFEKNGGSQALEADQVLLSIGRKPNTQGLGLEKLSVYLERGAVMTDETMQTNIPGLYAIGDVTGRYMLAHTAYRQGEVVFNTLNGKKDVMRYEAIPSVIYTNPEVASVGETERTAKEKGLRVKSVTLPNQMSGRYVAETEDGDGITKILIDPDTQTVIGVHIIGNYASEIIYGAAMMIENRTPLEQLKRVVFPHPTMGEVIKEGLFEF
ncbi:MAG TPA: dihydrolipoyl dehydrogenase [Eubacteriaceae bacterium]|nr:dihydrolipoyl dehydrogenase [Eubacteriaceae bacterium]